MPRFSANLHTMFPEFEFLDRFAAAASVGFEAVEFRPYGFPEDEIKKRLAEHNLIHLMGNFPGGETPDTANGFAIFPDHEEGFRAAVMEGIRWAKVTGCRQLNCIAGDARPGDDPKALHVAMVANLKFAAAACGKEGIKVTFEPINNRDRKTYFLTTTKQARAMLAEIGSDNLSIQYDIYHAQIMEGDIARTIQENLAYIGHIQFADNPGRAEPGTGEINFPFLFRHLDLIGYKGWVGAEYKPRRTTREGMDWFTTYRRRA